MLHSGSTADVFAKLACRFSAGSAGGEVYLWRFGDAVSTAGYTPLTDEPGTIHLQLNMPYPRMRLAELPPQQVGWQMDWHQATACYSAFAHAACGRSFVAVLWVCASCRRARRCAGGQPDADVRAGGGAGRGHRGCCAQLGPPCLSMTSVASQLNGMPAPACGDH